MTNGRKGEAISESYGAQVRELLTCLFRSVVLEYQGGLGEAPYIPSSVAPRSSPLRLLECV